MYQNSHLCQEIEVDDRHPFHWSSEMSIQLLDETKD